MNIGIYPTVHPLLKWFIITSIDNLCRAATNGYSDSL
jgi:hypothetical protein